MVSGVSSATGATMVSYPREPRDMVIPDIEHGILTVEEGARLPQLVALENDSKPNSPGHL